MPAHSYVLQSSTYVNESHDNSHTRLGKALLLHPMSGKQSDWIHSQVLGCLVTALCCNQVLHAEAHQANEGEEEKEKSSHQRTKNKELENTPETEIRVAQYLVLFLLLVIRGSMATMCGGSFLKSGLDINRKF